jgi:ABC-type oligopeptide transport system substrate-binding subunit
MIGSHIAGRYRLDAELGRGGMGTVYQARDSVLKRDVAVKLLSASGLGTEGRARLMNEAQATASLNHPNIVAVYDAGESEVAGTADPLPYIVMELLDGRTLHDQPPDSLGETLAITRQLCYALEHAHEQGIIHRDLKPENVMLVDEDTVKLMDFGLARSLTTRMTAEGTVMGTLFYMAPEMVMGQEVDGRADLYALGIMLYELTTGRLPFEAEDPVAVLTQHLHAPVVPPVAHNPELPPALDHLIVSLLAKEPDKRPASAAEVLVTLDDLDQPGHPAEKSRPLSTLDRIVRGRLVGREQELAEARAIWSQVVAGQGQVLLVTGEPGIGKTRLTEELITQASVSGGRTFTGASYAEGSSPYAPFRQILRHSMSEDGSELPQEILADLLTIAPELQANYPELPDKKVTDPQEEQQRLLDNVAHYFSLLSSRQPLLLVLEDAHWADSGTISLMRHLARNCNQQSLMLAVTYREVEIDEARTFHGALLDLQRERLASRIKLSRLDREGTRALLATLFDEEITPEFLDSIYMETEGNPFFIEEISKALVESGQLYFEGGRWQRPAIEELGIPQSIRVAIQARASGLSETSRNILEQAAVLGRVFDLPTLQLATEQDVDSLLDVLDEALAAQLVEEGGGDEESFSFVHALIPASLVAGLRALRRRRLQRRAAAAFETTHPEDYEVLAHHFIEAGQIDKGAHYLLQAGDRARLQYAHEEAIESYQSAIDYLKEDGQLEAAARALMKLGLAYNNAFDFASSRQAYQEGFALWQQTSKSPSIGSSQTAPHPLRLRWMEPTSLDPALAGDTPSTVFIDQLFSGLVQLTTEMDVVPDVAHSWQVLEEGRRYRIHLRDDVFWSDGLPVTAYDFAFAWRRILAPENKSPYAEEFYTIKNGRDFHEGRLKTWIDIGVKVFDDVTLEVTLENPDSTFIYLMSRTFPLPKHQLQKPDAPLGSWDKMVTNGPFKLVEWKKGQRMLLEANPNYHGHRSGNVEAVEIIVPRGEEDEGRLALYEADRLDMTTLAPIQVIQARNRFAGDHLEVPTLSTISVGFNTRKAPFADPRVRRAMALATDKQHLSEFRQDFSFPATGGLVPLGMPGHAPGIALPFDPEWARRLLVEAGYSDRSSFPKVELLIGPSYSQRQAFGYLATQWHELLGIEIEVIQLSWPEYLERRRTDPSAIFRTGWSATIPDPDDFLSFISFQDETGWQNETYERLVQQAKEMGDQDGRLALYRQAEEILAEEVPIIPLSYGNASLLIKPWVRRYPTSSLKLWYWKDVVIEPH